jgi:GrpB-like predicted nucleotidyltransferase (UPF0157 family)
MKEELVTIVEYNKEWANWFQEECLALTKILDKELVVKIEHFGSTAIPGGYAKPVIDILVGLKSFVLSDVQINAMAELGYKFIEKSSFCQRFYFKKRGTRNFNISFVVFSGDVWEKCINLRDYLRANPDKRDEYTKIKKDAISSGNKTVASYSKYKYTFVCKLCQEALEWRQSPSAQSLKSFEAF